ncbi:MAG: sigma-70 family RNA polymerase sigma factor [Planctomycetaceae bacterium]|nr:sigma-70 family RNA polymerase sigma factor [Planctomycetaceae bacterium]
MSLPETRHSLLLRVRDPKDQGAWEEFVQIYRPVILRIAACKGLQSADAEDLAQTVMLAISRAVERWTPDPERGRFRTWLHKVANNAILNALTRGVNGRTVNQVSIEQLLNEPPEREGPDTDLLQTEYRREIFRQAAAEIRKEFSNDTWNSFWQTAIDGLDVDEAARQLNRTRGSVYASRSRVMKRLRQVIEKYGDDGINS